MFIDKEIEIGYYKARLNKMARENEFQVLKWHNGENHNHMASK